MKAEAFFHLTANFNYLLMSVLSILMFPSMVIRYNMGWYEMLLIDVPLFFAATMSVCNFYIVCQREIHKDWVSRLRYMPFLMSIGIGLCVNNTRAVLEALFDKKSEFARTPKYRIEGDGDEWASKKYRQSVAVQPLIELALGLYFTATVFYALANGIYGTLPFLVLFQVGLPLHRPPLDRPAVRRRRRRAEDAGVVEVTRRPPSPRSESISGRRTDRTSVIYDMTNRRRASKTSSRPRRPSVIWTGSAACSRIADTTSTIWRPTRRSKRSATCSGTAGCRIAPNSATCSRSWPRARCRKASCA